MNAEYKWRKISPNAEGLAGMQWLHNSMALQSYMWKQLGVHTVLPPSFHITKFIEICLCYSLINRLSILLDHRVPDMTDSHSKVVMA